MVVVEQVQDFALFFDGERDVQLAAALGHVVGRPDDGDRVGQRFGKGVHRRVVRLNRGDPRRLDSVARLLDQSEQA